MSVEGNMMSKVIEVFADVGCPFTHVGLRRFVQRRDALGRSDLVLHVRAWPLEVVNGSPMDPGFIAEEVEQIRAALGGDVFVGFVPGSFPATSIPAMALAAAAYDVDPGIGESVSLRVRHLLFEEGVDVSDHAVLHSIAEGFGFEADLDDDTAVLEDHRRGVGQGVVGSPHFFTDGGDFFCPALAVGRDDEGVLQVSPDPERFDRFFASCLQ
ncbi:MAG: DsbA family protein [Microthrixaceae bacterium]